MMSLEADTKKLQIAVAAIQRFVSDERTSHFDFVLEHQKSNVVAQRHVVIFLVNNGPGDGNILQAGAVVFRVEDVLAQAHHHPVSRSNRTAKRVTLHIAVTHLSTLSQPKSRPKSLKEGSTRQLFC